jgi:predicted component of type VI protein secretion system
MLAKLKVTRKSDPKFLLQKEFDQDKITLGRTSQNDVQLTGMHVSGEHAWIARRGEAFELSDVSKNGTALNGEKLKSQRPHALRHGDRIAILDYVITFETSRAGGEDSFSLDNTLPFSDNPFQGEAKKLAEGFDRIYQTYARAETASRDDFLRRALHEALAHTPANGVRSILAEFFQGGKPLPRLIDEPPREKDKTEGLATQIEAALGGGPPAKPPVESRKSIDLKLPSDDSLPDIGGSIFFPMAEEDEAIAPATPARASNLVDRLNQTVDLLLDSTVKMIVARRDFRLTFLDETTIRKKPKKGEIDLNYCKWEELKEYLHDEMISAKDVEQRLAQLKRALKEIMDHQLSLVMGYRQSISAGSKKLLQTLSPAVLESEATSGILPFLAQANLWKFYQGKYEQIASEINRGFADFERKYFHDAFVNGYKNREVD